QADAAAPGLGGALVELLLDEGQLRLGDAGAIVANGDDDAPLIPPDSGVDALPGAAVLGGVVQHVAEHLLEPLRVPGDGVEELVPAVVGQFNGLLLEQLPVGVNGVLELRLEVHLFDTQGEAAILHLGEVQQLLHHGGEAAGLLEDDVYAPAALLAVPAAGFLQLQQGLPPAVEDRKSTRLNSSHVSISYAVFCLKKETAHGTLAHRRATPHES